MKVAGGTRRSIWLNDDGWSVDVIDQTRLPHDYAVLNLTTLAQAADAIRHMVVRGAPLIGATAAYGVCLGLREDSSDDGLRHAVDVLAATRPTAVNLRWALDDMRARLVDVPPEGRLAVAHARAAEICEVDVTTNRSIGDHGLSVIREIANSGRDPVNILTHCNAGWLATVGWGTATAPLYRASEEGIPIHVWVDETRPRNQGAALTAWELSDADVPHTVIADNAGGHLMREGRVDLCIVGTDRTTANGDVANKIGTYLKALAARDNDVPFYVGLPSPTIDWTLSDGADIPIEDRGAEEVTHITGRAEDGTVTRVRLVPPGSTAANPAFDVTPARLVTGLITERGICAASPEGLLGLFPEFRPNR